MEVLVCLYLLLPSIYIPDGHTTDDNAAYVRSTVRETVRCAGNAGDIPVFPFMWNCKSISNSCSMHHTLHVAVCNEWMQTTKQEYRKQQTSLVLSDQSGFVRPVWFCQTSLVLLSSLVLSDQSGFVEQQKTSTESNIYS